MTKSIISLRLKHQKRIIDRAVLAIGSSRFLAFQDLIYAFPIGLGLVVNEGRFFQGKAKPFQFPAKTGTGGDGRSGLGGNRFLTVFFGTWLGPIIFTVLIVKLNSFGQ